MKTTLKWLRESLDNKLIELFVLPKYKTSKFHEPEKIPQSSSCKYNLWRKTKHLKKKKVNLVIWSILHLDVKIIQPVRHRQRGKKWWFPACKDKNCTTLLSILVRNKIGAKQKENQHGVNVTFILYLIPKALSSRNPPKKQRTTFGQEYQAYSCMKVSVFRFRSWDSQKKTCQTFRS